MKLIRLTNIGDTIVEVLFAVAVLGLVMSTSLGIASRSLMSARQSQERGEALKITEGQLEKVKAVAALDFNRFSSGSIFCIRDNLTTASIGAMSNFPPIANVQFNAYQTAGCSSGFYHYAVLYEPGQQDLFTVLTRWERAGGGGYDEITMRYKVHR